MDIQFHGANCVTLQTKHARVLVDDNLAELGAKTVAKEGDIVLLTNLNEEKPKAATIVIDGPGEYEASGVSVYGIPARAHTDTEGEQTATMYKVMIDDLRVLLTGHIYPELNEAQLEAIGTVDVMIVPVGGHGLTLDAVGALQIIKKVEPKMVIPTHFASKGITYPVEQDSLEVVLKGLGFEPSSSVVKLKLKAADLKDNTELVVLEAV